MNSVDSLFILLSFGEDFSESIQFLIINFFTISEPSKIDADKFMKTRVLESEFPKKASLFLMRSCVISYDLITIPSQVMPIRLLHESIRSQSIFG